MENASYAIITPVYNDWKSFNLLLELVNESFNGIGSSVDVVVVNDASSCHLERISSISSLFKNISTIKILSLKRNMGHQKAIALAMSYISEHFKYKGVCVMDSDGEDHPKYIQSFINESTKNNDKKIIFAHRAKRSEGIVFRLFYYIYKKIFLLFTGSEISFGNFCYIPSNLIQRIASIPETWNHFAAAIIKSRVPYAKVPTCRSSRLDGSSKMNLVSLMLHGLSAIAVYSDVIGVRAVLFALGVVVLTFCGIISVFLVKIFTPLAIPGWASEMVFLLFIALLQSLILLVVFIFLILGNRSSITLIPERDYKHFVGEEELIS